MALFSRRADSRPRGPQAIVASARTVQVGDKKDAQRLHAARQSWQTDAWLYRDALPELGYAIRFSRNSAARIRLVPAYYDDPEQNPIPIGDSTAPPQLQADVQGLLDDLRGGAGGDGKILGPLIENLKIPGEAYLLGRMDQPGAPTEYTIRSIEELVVDQDGRWWLRDTPGNNTGGQQSGEPLNPDLTFVIRLWQQHPRFAAWADSPMRQLLDTCEELLLASRQIRASLRSRLAGAGILAIAAELDLPPIPTDGAGTDDDMEASPLMAALQEAMLAPIADPGHPSAVVPILLKGPHDQIKDGLNYLSFAQLLDPKILDLIERAIGRLATGLDLPREVILGVADVNHWGAWQVSDDTFRHHLEPDIQTATDALTVGYLRAGLEGLGYPPETVRRCAIWYDPTELLTHPDRSKDALDAWDRNTISDDTLLRAMGWAETDKPSKEELLLRLLTHQRSWSPNIVEAIVHRFFPDLDIPSGGPTAPGSDSQPAVPDPAPAPQTVDRTPGPPPQPDDPQPSVAPALPASAALTAASRPQRRLSQRLMLIDRQLRDRLTAAAHTTLQRVLDRAGNRARSKAPRAVQASLAGMTGRQVLTHLGRDTVIASFGLDEQTLLDDEMQDLQASWDEWVAGGQRQALDTACQIAGLDPADPRLDTTRRLMVGHAQAGWTLLAQQLRQKAADLMWTAPTDDDETPATLAAPTSLVRTALALAGGAAALSGFQGVDDSGRLTGVTGYVGGVGTGATITDLLSGAGVQQDTYEWEYGVSERSFEPHVALDGLVFSSFDDPALANDSDFPDAAFYLPGDHDGCSCDVTILWAVPDDETAADDLPLAASAVLNGKARR